MKRVPNIEIGAQFDMRLSPVIVREVVRVSANLYEIHDTSGTWCSAMLSKENLEKVMNGQMTLDELNWK